MLIILGVFNPVQAGQRGPHAELVAQPRQRRGVRAGQLRPRTQPTTRCTPSTAAAHTMQRGRDPPQRLLLLLLLYSKCGQGGRRFSAIWPAGGMAFRRGLLGGESAGSVRVCACLERACVRAPVRAQVASGGHPGLSHCGKLRRRRHGSVVVPRRVVASEKAQEQEQGERSLGLPRRTDACWGAERHQRARAGRAGACGRPAAISGPGCAPSSRAGAVKRMAGVPWRAQNAWLWGAARTCARGCARARRGSCAFQLLLLRSRAPPAPPARALAGARRPRRCAAPARGACGGRGGTKERRVKTAGSKQKAPQHGERRGAGPHRRKQWQFLGVSARGGVPAARPQVGGAVGGRAARARPERVHAWARAAAWGRGQFPAGPAARASEVCAAPPPPPPPPSRPQHGGHARQGAARSGGRAPKKGAMDVVRRARSERARRCTVARVGAAGAPGAPQAGRGESKC